jgi:hypothetical protein
MDTQAQSAEAELREARARLELRALSVRERIIDRAERRLRESFDPWFSTGRDVRALDTVRLNTGQLLGAHVSTAADRRYGNYAPFWRTWYEHSRLRAGARLIYGLSPLCSGAVRGLRSYCVGEGFTYQAVAKKGRDAPPELVEAVQDAVEDFDRRNRWTGRESKPGQQSQDSWEGELFVRSVVDGEAAVREYEPEPGRLVVRPVEPEWVVEPPGLREEVSYGVLTDRDDLCTVTGYFLSYGGSTADGEEAPVAGEGDGGVHFLKRNTPRTVKRGMPDLAYGTHDALRAAGRLLENLAEGASIQASLALIRQHTGTPKDVVQEFADSVADYDRPDVFTGGRESVESFRPGKILDIPDSIQFALPSFGANQQAFIPVVQAVLRSIAVKWNAPEWLTSGDASNNNYASSLTAESPFVKGIKSEQRTVYAPFYLCVVWRAVEIAARAGKVVTPDGRVWGWQEIRRLVDIQATPPTVETRDKGQEAQQNQTYVGMGVKSPQTVQGELGLDPDKEMAQIEEWRKRFGSGGGQVPDQGDPQGGFFGIQEGRLREAEERTDKAGNKYCVEKGQGRVECPEEEGGGSAARKADGKLAVPQSREQAKALASILRKGVERECEDPSGFCVSAALALADVMDGAELWSGHYSGKWGNGPHTIVKAGDYFIDVSSDQFGSDAPVRVWVAGRNPPQYSGFEPRPTKSMSALISSAEEAEAVDRIARFAKKHFARRQGAAPMQGPPSAARPRTASPTAWSPARAASPAPRRAAGPAAPPPAPSGRTWTSAASPTSSPTSSARTRPSACSPPSRTASPAPSSPSWRPGSRAKRKTSWGGGAATRTASPSSAPTRAARAAAR